MNNVLCCSYIARVINDCDASSETRTDRALRVMMLNIFSKLHHDVPEHCAFANMMIEELMATQRHLVAVKTYRNFPNCSSHLRKHRVCCALLVLDVFVTEVGPASIYYVWL